jgi:hypothetical protein
MRRFETMLLLAALALTMAGCSGSSYQMTPVYLEAPAAIKPIEDVLIIVVIDDQEIRAIFEKHFKDWFTYKGIEAITSTEVLPIKKDGELDKETILKVVDKYGHDSILITNLEGYEEEEVFSRDLPRFHGTYYGFYRYAWGYVYWPTIYGENVQFTLETRLYSLKSESLIWAGDSKVVNPGTVGKAIGQVVESVIQELEKNGMLPKPS